MATPRNQIIELIRKLWSRQSEVSRDIIASVKFEDLELETDDGFTIKDVLQMWVHEIRAHHRDMLLARGKLVDDDPHFHVPHFVRRANEEFGKLIGELSALSDEDLDRQVPPDGRTIRELAEHVLESLDGFFVQQAQSAIKKKS